MSNKFSRTITDWYREFGRELPWRDTNDPYLIWISEIILQQTRVAQGYSYFQRFISRFPDVATLANAQEEEVMKYWEGLGYYSRARNLHAAARSMNGVFPTTYEGVRALKGVGDYTAAAICSFAYRMPYAVVDGNVYRVLSRYFGIDIPIDSTQGRKLFHELAMEVMDARRPDVYNQAIMDFGALQCTPVSPKCLFCPLSGSCKALAQGKVASLPVKQHKTRTVDRYFNYLYVDAGAYTFLRQRTGNDIWKNLFEFPLIETATPVEQAELLQLPGFTSLIRPGEKPAVSLICRDIKHVLSHRIIYASFYKIELPEQTLSFEAYRKVRKEEIGTYALSRLILKFMDKHL